MMRRLIDITITIGERGGDLVRFLAKSVRAVFAIYVIWVLAAFPNAEHMGDRLQFGLPITGLVCANDLGEVRDYAGRFAVGFLTVHGFKNALPDEGINLRPDGGGNGFPSGHTYAAVYGASYLARQCAERVPYLGVIAVVAGGFTAASRVEADRHTVFQVLWGTIFALIADRGFRQHSPRAWLGHLAARLRRHPRDPE